MNRFTTLFRRRYALIALAIALAVFGAVTNVQAGGFSNAGGANVTLSNENPSQTSVTHTFNLRPDTTGSTIRCFKLQTQTPQGTNALPTGMSLASAAGGTTTGLGGLTYTADTAGAATGLIKYTNATGSTPTNPISLAMTAITNSSATGTYFFAIDTYTNVDCSTGPIDTGTVAFVIANSTVTVNATINETLTFSLSATTVNLGVLSSSSVSSGNHTFAVATNAGSGWTVTAQGTTLTKGSDTVPFCTDNDIIAAGNNKYGPTYTGGTGNPANCRNVATIETVASSATSTAGDTTTATYNASPNTATPAGAYVSSITYVATASF